MAVWNAVLIMYIRPRRSFATTLDCTKKPVFNTGSAVVSLALYKQENRTYLT